MKTITYDGTSVLTTDAVADALLELAAVLGSRNAYEPVTVPVLVRGRVEELRVMLGPSVRVSSLSAGTEPQVEVEGAADAAERLLQRAAEARDPFRDLELQEPWS